MVIEKITVEIIFGVCVLIVIDSRHMLIMNGRLDMLKRCPRCGETKDPSHYYYSSYTTNNLYTYCKPCCKERDREKSAKRAVTSATVIRQSKVCGICKLEKPISQFGRNKNRADRHHSYCKPCWVIYVTKQQKKARNLL